MRVILGIGNQGSRYKNNRHNVGFLFLNYFASKYSLSFTPSKEDYYFCEGKIGNDGFSLVKPTTYVNNSGIAAAQALRFYKTDFKDLLIVYDDINLEFADIRVKASGGDGGHNGVQSLIYHLQTEQFSRIRIGIGRNFDKGFMADYVLTDFDKKEFKELEDTFNACLVLAENFIQGGVKELLDANSKLSKKNSK